MVSLFIRVPIDLAIGVANCRQESDKTLEDRTCLSVSSIVTLLKLCLEAMYLTFKGEMYQQVFRTAMGSPVSVVVVIVMEDVEERALASFPDPPKFWKRYVDDVCVAMREDQIETFLDHLNNIELTIQFTVETETEDGTLPFLDICLHHEEEGTVQTSIYRKPCHTDRYLDFTSHHLVEHKKRVIRALFTRAECLSYC